MDEEIVYANAEWAEVYRALYPDDHTSDEVCEHVFLHGDVRGQRCGLPAWDGSHGPDGPRCEFHGACLFSAPNDPGERAKSLVRGSRKQCRLVDAWLGCADLEGTDLRGVRLEGARLGWARMGGADLSYTRLEDADLEGADLLCAFLRGAHLERAKLKGARLHGARLWHAHLEGAGLNEASLRACAHPSGRGFVQVPTDLRGTDLRGVDFTEATISPDCRFDGAKFGREVDSPGETRVLGDDPDVYRQLKLAFQNAGDYAKAGDFYYEEMRSRRERAREGLRSGAAEHPPWRGLWRAFVACRVGCGWWRPLAEWWRDTRRGEARRLWWEWLFEKLCGYGERPWNVLGGAAGVILVCALLQGGLCGLKEEGVTQTPGLRLLGSAFYQSVVTFSTLGYGDITPLPGWGRAIAGGEALSGAFLMALLLVCVVRRYGR